MPTELDLGKGRIIRVGQLYRDNRASNIRTLRVDSIGVYSTDRLKLADADREITCTVIRQEYQGTVTEPMRVTAMTARRLTSRAFVPVPPADDTQTAP